MTRSKFFVILFTILYISSFAQINPTETDIDYYMPKEYTIGGISVSGIENLDNNAIILLSNLNVGDKISVPGDDVSSAIKKLWDQGLFSEVNISIEKIIGENIFLMIQLKERPRLFYYKFKGIKKREENDLKDLLKISRGEIITDNLLKNNTSKIKKHFVDKGYLFADVSYEIKKDSLPFGQIGLVINVNKKEKVKINSINIIGNNSLDSRKLKKALKNTKEKKLYNVFKSSKYDEISYKEDKESFIDKYNSLGYRDAKIIRDSVYRFDDKTINIDIEVEEGHKYFFRNITWVGNTKYSSKELSSRLGIKRGDIYNQKLLNNNLYMSPDARDVSSLYLDDGYLFFNAMPIEIIIDNDSIDLEIRINEGKQAVINKITIVGNDKTNDHVIIREIRTKPGQLFNRSDIIRSHRELAQLRYFNAEKLNVVPKPNPIDGTVDIEYTVEEVSTDQLELSGGWGGGTVVGTLGVSFNNFSFKNIGNSRAWRPLPSGDGQRISLRAQSSGIWYQAYSASFVEPWLGGRRPNSLSVSVYNSIQTNGVKKGEEGRTSVDIKGASVGLGRRLKWPDDYFTIYNSISYQNYSLNSFSDFLFSDGYANSLSFSSVISRNSVDQPIYPRSGSEITLSLQATPPFSLFNNKDYSTVSDQEKYKWIEFYKIKFSTSWFTKLAGDLVLNAKTNWGFLGMYNQDIGITPFERFWLGGDGLTGYSLDGRETIGLRGYNNNSLTPYVNSYVGGAIFNKHTLELRYPLSLNPAASFYVLGFCEAGSSWLTFKEFKPFDVHRSAGIGVRLFLPMFQIGLDWGYGFDEVKNLPGVNKGQFHFLIGPPQ